MSDPEGYRFLPHAEDVCQCEGCTQKRVREDDPETQEED